MTSAPTPCPIARFAIEHTPQSQTARQTAKTLARVFMWQREKLITTRPIARLP
jgi:hypothetical protein